MPARQPNRKLLTVENGRSKGEQAFMLQARADKLPDYEREYFFHPDCRRYWTAHGKHSEIR